MKMENTGNLWRAEICESYPFASTVARIFVLFLFVCLLLFLNL